MVERPIGERLISAERAIRRVNVGPLGERQARGIAKAVATNSHTESVLSSDKLGRVDLSKKWVRTMQRVVEAEMRARGLIVSTDVIGRMRGLVRTAYEFGKDVAMEEAKDVLGEYYEIFEKHIDEWVTEYTKIRESVGI